MGSFSTVMPEVKIVKTGENSTIGNYQDKYTDTIHRFWYTYYYDSGVVKSVSVTLSRKATVLVFGAVEWWAHYTGDTTTTFYIYRGGVDKTTGRISSGFNNEYLRLDMVYAIETLDAGTYTYDLYFICTTSGYGPNVFQAGLYVVILETA